MQILCNAARSRGGFDFKYIGAIHLFISRNLQGKPTQTIFFTSS